MIEYHAAHTEVQLLVAQILMNFAVCDESRPFLLDHGGLVDVMVEAVGMNQLREAVRTSALKALLELGRADNRVILNRVRDFLIHHPLLCSPPPLRCSTSSH